MLRALTRPLTLVSVASLSLIAGTATGFADDDPFTATGPYPGPPPPGCTKPDDAATPPPVIIGDGRQGPADIIRVPAHIDEVELVSAEWGVMPGQYLDSWLRFGGGQFLWKRSRSAPGGGELGAEAVNWSGVDDNNQELPGAKGNTSVALYKYTIKSSTERTKSVKRFATATVNAEAGGAWATGSVNAKIGTSIDSEDNFNHNVSEKVDIAISIKCAAFKVTAAPTPDPAILYFQPDSVKRDLPLPIKDAEGKPKTIKWNPIVLDAAFSADNGATGGNAIACWFSYKGAVEKGEITNTSWDTKKGVSAELGVSNGWRIWKFTADISVEGKTAGEWNNLDKTEFSKGSAGTWALTGNDDWRFPEPPTQQQRDDFQTPCKKNNDPAACAAWDNIKAAYISEVIKIKGEDGATEYGPNYRMIEWQNAMLSGSFRKVGDWLDSSTFFDLAELQQVGTECAVNGHSIRIYNATFKSDDVFDVNGPLFGVSSNRCTPDEIAKPMDTTTKVGKLELSVIDKGNGWRHEHEWEKRKGHQCDYKNWDWNVKYPYAFWYAAQAIAHRVSEVPKTKGRENAPDKVCWGCSSIGGVECKD